MPQPRPGTVCRVSLSDDRVALLPPIGSITRVAHYVGSAAFGGATPAIVVAAVVAAALLAVLLIIPRLRAMVARHHPSSGAAVAPTVWSGLLGAAFAAVAVTVHLAGAATRFDRPTLQWFVTHRSPSSTSVLRAATDVGSPGVVGSVAVAAGVLLLWRGRRGEAVLMIAAAVTASVGVTVSKHVVGVSRPPLSTRLVAETNASFPSGHVMGTLVVYGLLAALVCRSMVRRWLRVLLRFAAAMVVAGISVTRLYLGVHWLSDIVGALLLGGALLLAFVAVHAVLIGRRSIAGTRQHRPVDEVVAVGSEVGFTTGSPRR